MLKRFLPAALIALTACGQDAGSQNVSSAGISSSCKTRSDVKLGGPISLINQDGVRVTEDDFKGRHALVFFGFTYCPDVCPYTLYGINAALEELPEGTEKPLTIMITVDPERDTPEEMKAYIQNDNFPADIVGLTGSEAEIKAASEAFGSVYSRIEDDKSEAGYTMEHMAIIYLMDENWKLESFFLEASQPDKMTECLAEFLPSTD